MTIEPERIDRILKLIEELWKKYPSQRFGQLVLNFACNRTGLNGVYNQEDDNTEEQLTKALEEANS